MTHKLLIAGEHPPTREKTPFTSRAGNLLREIMQAAKIDPDRAGFCYPGDKAELEHEIQVNGSQYVVLSGLKVLHLLHPELQTGECHGRIMASGALLVMPIFNHEAVVRMPKEFRPVVTKELALFRRVAQTPESWQSHIPMTCVKCRGPKFKMTPERVVYCERHWRRAG